jgi:hypothetical protein
MAFRLITRRPGAFGVALTVYELWRRLPPEQRRQLLAATRKHGPRLAARAIQGRRRAPKSANPS